MTTEQKRFLEHIKMMAEYWNTIPETDLVTARKITQLDRIEGLAFSILVALDGGAATGPYAVRPINGKGKEGKDIAGSLHEYFSMMD